MMRFWKEEYTRPERRGPSTAMSIAVHGGLIFLAVLATNPPPGLVSLLSLANKVYYLAPTPRIPSTEGSAAKVQFVVSGPVGPGAGNALGKTPTDKPVTAISRTPGSVGRDSVTSAAVPAAVGQDSVFSQIDVDSVAQTDPLSAAPAYPDALRKMGVEGAVSVRYVVDSTGLADPSSLVILHSTRVEFAVAVRSALPYMHFVPAKIGPKRVRQWVVQDFHFRIEKPVVDTTAAKKKPPVA